jgi:DNA-binding NtrC family response regulator
MTASEEARILIVDDEESMRFMLGEMLSRAGYEHTEAESGDVAIESMEQNAADIVILDYRMPGMDGLETMKKILTGWPETIVIMVTAHDSREIAVKAIKAGAYDYFSKPFDLDELRMVIRRAMEKRRLQRQVQSLSQALTEKEPLGEIIGCSRRMQSVFEMIRRVADRDVNVLISGESGTGKELVARALHLRSGRAKGPFIPINCAAIPSTLLESELFGHERGAFTGAVARKPGKLEVAKGGTLFLDEIGDMDFSLQAKILRVIQEKEFERVGGSSRISADFRLVCATNKDLAEAVQQGEFREDLYFRINVIGIQLPPLRDRVEDIPLLVNHFLTTYGEKYRKNDIEMSNDAMALLTSYSFPGNVRELENILQRTVVLNSSGLILPGDFPPEVSEDAGESMAVASTHYAPAAAEEAGTDAEGLNLQEKMREMTEAAEKDVILKALNECQWRRGKTAEKLGISRRSLLRKMKKYGIS